MCTLGATGEQSIIMLKGNETLCLKVTKMPQICTHEASILSHPIQDMRQIHTCSWAQQAQGKKWFGLLYGKWKQKHLWWKAKKKE